MLYALAPITNRSIMLQIFKELDLAVPADVSVSVSSRVFTVKGPRGSLTKVSIPAPTHIGSSIRFQSAAAAAVMEHQWEKRNKKDVLDKACRYARIRSH